MKPPDDQAPTNGMTYATLADVADIEASGFECGYFYVWARLANGACALWDYQLGAPPGQDQRLRVIEGA